jgi:hypothetical protein
MNKAILAGVALAATAASVCAQGTLSLNSATGAKPRITVNGVNAAPADNIFVEVLVAGATSLSGAGAEPFALTLTGANQGLFSKGTLTVNGKPGGAAVDVTIRAWDKDTGADYASATVKAAQTLTGFVLGGVVDANGIAGLPNSIVGGANGFTGLNLVPEPSTYALAALGLGGLLFLRRK